MKLLVALLLFPALAWGQVTTLGSGLVVRGQIGPSAGGCAGASFRADAQIEVANCTLGRHAVISLYNADLNDESAITMGAPVAGVPFQITSMYSRLVNGNGGYGWMGVLGFHIVGHDIGQGGDSTDFLLYPRNSVKLAAGPTTGTVQNFPPPPNTVELGAGSETPAPVGVGLLLHPMAAPAPRNDGGTLYMGMDGRVYVMMPSGIPKQIAP